MLFLKLIKNRKGVSPLIATVLLIAFAVALGAIVMNWGRNYIENQQTSSENIATLQIECQTEVEFEITNVDYEGNTTLDGADGGIKITLNNKKGKTLKGFAFKFFDENNKGITISKASTKTNSSNDLQGLEIKTYEIDDTEFDDYDLEDLGTLDKIIVVPYILPNDDLANDIEACVNYEVETEFGDIAWPTYNINFTTT